MSNRSLSVSMSMHMDVVVHVPSLDGGVIVEAAVFARSPCGELRTLGRSFTPLRSLTSDVVTVRLQYDAWSSQLLVGLGSLPLPVLQVTCVVFPAVHAVFQVCCSLGFPCWLVLKMLDTFVVSLNYRVYPVSVALASFVFFGTHLLEFSWLQLL